MRGSSVDGFTLIDSVQIVGSAVAVLGTVILMPSAWKFVWLQLCHLMGRCMPAIRVSSVRVTTDPAEIAEITSAQASEAHNLVHLNHQQLAVANGRGFVALAVGVVMTGLPDWAMPDWICVILLVVAGLGIVTALPPRWIDAYGESRWNALWQSTEAKDARLQRRAQR